MSKRYHAHDAPRARRAPDTGRRRAHSHCRQRPASPFDARHLTHERLEDAETGEQYHLRRLSEEERALGLTPAMSDGEREARFLEARSERVSLALSRDVVVSVARGEVLNREARAARHRARAARVVERRRVAREARVGRVASSDRRVGSSAVSREAWERSREAVAREAAAFEALKAAAREARGAARRAEASLVEGAAERAVGRVRARKG